MAKIGTGSTGNGSQYRVNEKNIKGSLFQFCKKFVQFFLSNPTDEMVLVALVMARCKLFPVSFSQ
jgi:hypothetical protein